MIIKSCASSLAQAAKDLSVEWRETKTRWRDGKAREFGEEYIDPIPPEVARAIEAMEELDRVLRRIRSECE